MSKVVAFQRSAEYLHQRAMRNRRSANMLDALDLMRRALERDGDNLEYLMDAAELLCEMGCHRASVRLLIKILCSGEPLDECYFGMSCNYIGMRDYGAAFALMYRFLALDPSAIERGEVSSTLSMLLTQRREEWISGRKRRRTQRFYERARAHLRAGRRELCVEALVRGVRLSPKVREPRALLAQCLLDAGRPRAAMDQILRAMRSAKPSFQGCCTLALARAALGDRQGALRLLSALMGKNRDEDQNEALISALVRLDARDQLDALTTASLKLCPYDARLLHIRAVVRLRQGATEAQVKPLWDRILRLDPDDSVAHYFSALCTRGGIRELSPSYEYEVPQAEADARAHWLFAQTAGSAAIQWEESARMRHLLRWALESGGASLGAHVLALLAHIDAGEVDLLLREYLLRPDAPEANKALALSALMRRGARPPYLVIEPDGELRDGAQSPMPKRPLTIGQRRVLGEAVRAHRPRHRSFALLDAPWEAFLATRAGRPMRIRRPRGWAAALLAYRLHLMEDPVAVRLITGVFGCSPRMLRHRAGKIQTALKAKGEPNETD